MSVLWYATRTQLRALIQLKLHILALNIHATAKNNQQLLILISQWSILSQSTRWRWSMRELLKNLKEKLQQPATILTAISNAVMSVLLSPILSLKPKKLAWILYANAISTSSTKRIIVILNVLQGATISVTETALIVSLNVVATNTTLTMTSPLLERNHLSYLHNKNQWL